MTEARPSRVPGWLVLVGAMSAIGPFTIDMYLPGFPAIERELAEDGVERTMAAYLVGITVGQLIYGPISDRFGRKPPLYFGFVLYMVGAIGCALASSMTMLIVLRVLQALGACAGLVIGRAIVRDRCQPHEAARAFATLMAIIALGPILAPILGGWVVSATGWRGVFVFQALLGASMLIAMHVLLQESRPTTAIATLHPGAIARRYWHLARDPGLVGYSMVAGFGMGVMFCYVTGSPIVMSQAFQLSPDEFGWMLGLNGLAFMAASRLNVMALNRRGPAEVLNEAIVWPVVAGTVFFLLALLLSLPLWGVIVVQLLYFVSTARIMPHTSALALAPYGQEAGIASALMGSLQSFVATLAGIAVAVFNDGTLHTLAALMLGGSVLSFGSHRWAKWVSSRS
jgi:DHA1 family bicyclomycin/chloramphenicol resistance-like MFS transporter